MPCAYNSCSSQLSSFHLSMGQCLWQLYSQIWWKGAYHACCSVLKNEELLLPIARNISSSHDGKNLSTSNWSSENFMPPLYMEVVTHGSNTNVDDMPYWYKNSLLTNKSATRILMQMSWYKLGTHGWETAVFKITCREVISRDRTVFTSCAILTCNMCRRLSNVICDMTLLIWNRGNE